MYVCVAYIVVHVHRSTRDALVEVSEHVQRTRICYQIVNVLGCLACTWIGFRSVDWKVEFIVTIFLFQFELGLLVVFLSLFQFPVAVVWRSVSSVTKDIMCCVRVCVRI